MYDEQKAEVSCDGEDGHFVVAHSPKEKEPGRPQGENNSIRQLPSMIISMIFIDHADDHAVQRSVILNRCKGFIYPDKARHTGTQTQKERHWALLLLERARAQWRYTHRYL